MENAPIATQPFGAFAQDKKKGTILLVSGEFDKAILAFEIAAGFQAMGMEMSMWFVLYGANGLLKPRSLFSSAKWFGKLRGGPGPTPETNVVPPVVRGLNHDGALISRSRSDLGHRADAPKIELRERRVRAPSWLRPRTATWVSGVRPGTPAIPRRFGRRESERGLSRQFAP